MSERYPIIVQIAALFLILSLLAMNVYIIYRLTLTDRLARYDEWIKKVDTNVGQINAIINKNVANGKLENPFQKEKK